MGATGPCGGRADRGLDMLLVRDGGPRTKSRARATLVRHASLLLARVPRSPIRGQYWIVST